MHTFDLNAHILKCYNEQNFLFWQGSVGGLGYPNPIVSYSRKQQEILSIVAIAMICKEHFTGKSTWTKKLTFPNILNIDQRQKKITLLRTLEVESRWLSPECHDYLYQSYMKRQI